MNFNRFVFKSISHSFAALPFFLRYQLEHSKIKLVSVHPLYNLRGFGSNVCIVVVLLFQKNEDAKKEDGEADDDDDDENGNDELDEETLVSRGIQKFLAYFVEKVNNSVTCNQIHDNSNRKNIE